MYVPSAVPSVSVAPAVSVPGPGDRDWLLIVVNAEFWAVTVPWSWGCAESSTSCDMCTLAAAVEAAGATAMAANTTPIRTAGTTSKLTTYFRRMRCIPRPPPLFHFGTGSPAPVDRQRQGTVQFAHHLADLGAEIRPLATCAPSLCTVWWRESKQHFRGQRKRSFRPATKEPLTGIAHKVPGHLETSDGSRRRDVQRAERPMLWN